jgi:hypothetical protein
MPVPRIAERVRITAACKVGTGCRRWRPAQATVDPERNKCLATRFHDQLRIEATPDTCSGNSEGGKMLLGVRLAIHGLSFPRDETPVIENGPR